MHDIDTTTKSAEILKPTDTTTTTIITAAAGGGGSTSATTCNNSSNTSGRTSTHNTSNEYRPLMNASDLLMLIYDHHDTITDSTFKRVFERSWGITEHTSVTSRHRNNNISRIGLVLSIGEAVIEKKIRKTIKDVNTMRQELRRVSRAYRAYYLFKAFVKDMIRYSVGSSSISSSRNSHSTDGSIVPFYKKAFIVLSLLVAHGFCIMICSLLALGRDISWVRVWIITCIVYVIIDVIIFQSILCIIVDYWLPSLMYNNMQTIKNALFSIGNKYFHDHLVLDYTTTERYYSKHLDSDDDVDNNFIPTRKLSAPEHVYPSHIVAKEYASNFEGRIILSYHHPCPRPPTAIIPDTALSSSSSSLLSVVVKMVSSLSNTVPVPLQKMIFNIIQVVLLLVLMHIIVTSCKSYSTTIIIIVIMFISYLLMMMMIACSTHRRHIKRSMIVPVSDKDSSLHDGDSKINSNDDDDDSDDDDYNEDQILRILLADDIISGSGKLRSVKASKKKTSVSSSSRRSSRGITTFTTATTDTSVTTPTMTTKISSRDLFSATGSTYIVLIKQVIDDLYQDLVSSVVLDIYLEMTHHAIDIMHRDSITTTGPTPTTTPTTTTAASNRLHTFCQSKIDELEKYQTLDKKNEELEATTSRLKLMLRLKNKHNNDNDDHHDSNPNDNDLTLTLINNDKIAHLQYELDEQHEHLLAHKRLEKNIINRNPNPNHELSIVKRKRTIRVRESSSGAMNIERAATPVASTRITSTKTSPSSSLMPSVEEDDDCVISTSSDSIPIRASALTAVLSKRTPLKPLSSPSSLLSPVPEDDQQRLGRLSSPIKSLSSPIKSLSPRLSSTKQPLPSIPLSIAPTPEVGQKRLIRVSSSSLSLSQLQALDTLRPSSSSSSSSVKDEKQRLRVVVHRGTTINDVLNPNPNPNNT